MTAPTFLLLGAPKAGTTSVARHLNEHPEVFVSNYVGRTKEPHYFSYVGDQKPHWAVKTWDGYLALFDSAASHVARGEKSTWYLYSPSAAEQVAARLPDARLVAFLRNPVDRAYSSWSYRVQMGHESLSFEKALAAEPARIAAGSPWDVHYQAAGRYASQVSRYLDLFPRDQIRFVVFEDLVSSSDAIVRDLLGFLGVDPDKVTLNAGAVHNKTVYPKSVALNELLRQSPLKSVLRRLMPARLWAQVGDRVRKANMGTRPPLDPELRRELVEDYRPDVVRLSALVGRDLESLWFGSLKS